MIKNDNMERYVADRHPHLAAPRHRADRQDASDPWVRPLPRHA